MSIDPATLCDLFYSPDKVGLYQDDGGTTPSVANNDDVSLRQDQSASSNDFSNNSSPAKLVDHTTWWAVAHTQGSPSPLANPGADFDIETNQPLAFICECEVTNAGLDNALAGNYSGTGWYVFVGGTNQVFVGIHGASGAAVVYTDADAIPSNTKKIIAARYDGSGSASGITLFINGVMQFLTVLSDALAGTSVTGAPCYLAARGDGVNLGGEQSHPGISSMALTDEELIGMSDWLGELTGIYTPGGGAAARLVDGGLINHPMMGGGLVAA